MAVELVIEEDVLWLTCWYAPQGGRSLKDKYSFNDVLKGEWDIHSADDFVICFGIFNLYVGRHIDRLDGVHGVHGMG